MAQYRVRDGHELPHHGRVLTAGETVELSESVAADAVIRYRIEPVAVSPPPAVVDVPPVVDTPVVISSPSADVLHEPTSVDIETSTGTSPQTARRPVVKVKE